MGRISEYVWYLHLNSVHDRHVIIQHILCESQADKMTALMYAVKHGYTDVIQMLVKHKANLLITDAVS